MAVQKSRKSRSRRDMRRSHHRMEMAEKSIEAPTGEKLSILFIINTVYKVITYLLKTLRQQKDFLFLLPQVFHQTAQHSFHSHHASVPLAF